jgi:aminoglycoside phosphotransferase family enzyme/predicted kinase
MSDSESAQLDFRELLNPGIYPHEVGDIKRGETHVSCIVRTGPFAYKVKKSVRLEFLDSTQLSVRRRLCEEELRLNRRLAPTLYVDVVAITRDAHGLHVGGPGRAVEYAVRMRQFDASEELPALLERRDVSCAELASLGARLGDFHARAPRLPAARHADYVEQLRQVVFGNLATLLKHDDIGRKTPELGHLIDWTHDGFKQLSVQIADRLRRGFVRECHGDLHAHNVVRWEGRLTPFDCLEFDPTLRWIDVVNDIAFLFMDLIAYRRKDLAYQFLSSYLEVTGDYGGTSLLAFFSVHRALVRAMVDALSAERHRDAEQHRDAEISPAKRMLARIRTAEELTHPGKPALFIMHGPSGSGKSWLSERLVPMLGAIRIRSDIERKRVRTFPTGDRPAADRYAPSTRALVYRWLAECASGALSAGLRTIVDATFLRFEDRQAFGALAAHLGADFIIVSCAADKAELIRRIRARIGRDPSEADVAVLENQLESLEPLRPQEQEAAVRIDTGASDPEVAARMRLASYL